MTTNPVKRELKLEIPFNYKSRPYQLSFWQAMADGIKRAVLVWHRRAGKEKTCFNYLIKEAIKRVGIYYYIFPDAKMGRRIIWDGIDKEGFKTLKHIPEELVQSLNNTEMKIVLRNGSIILVLGSHDVDSLRGPNPIGVVFSEYAEQSPQAWQVISPILRENGGWAIFNFTPKGQNHAKDLLDLAVIHRETWFSEILSVNDTGVITPEDIEKERAESMMSEDMIQQEYYCSFTLGIEGSYYAKYIKEAKDEGRITNVPWDRQALVNTVWDIGYGDSTAIIFYQLVGQEIHIIDYYENHGEGLPHYKKVLEDKRYSYDSHFAPHDIESHAFSSGLSAKEVGAKLGISFVTLPTLKLRIEDGIEALRGIFPRIWFDVKKCSALIKAIENYRKEFDEKNNVYKSRPLHDWTSHACFVGGALISTDKGDKRIDEMCVGDLVLTPNGYRKVLSRVEYNVSDLVRIETSNKHITCTLNHKIFTNEGLSYADSLSYNTVLFTSKRIVRWVMKKLFGSTSTQQCLGFRESFSLAKEKIKSFSMDINLGGMDSIIDEERPHATHTRPFKEQFMPSTKVKSLKDFMFTTWTGILRIITSLIWKLFTLPCIPKDTKVLKEERSLGNLYESLCSTPKNGIKVLREENGIVNMPKEIVVLENLRIFQKDAFSAKKNTSLFMRIKNYVRMVVRRNRDINLVSTMHPGIAWYVAKYLWLIGIGSSERVVKVVPLSLPTTQKVYDIEVETDHCYYANGLLVSNSDSARYMAIAVRMFVDKPYRGINDAQSEEWFRRFNPRFE